MSNKNLKKQNGAKPVGQNSGKEMVTYLELNIALIQQLRNYQKNHLAHLSKEQEEIREAVELNQKLTNELLEHLTLTQEKTENHGTKKKK